MNYSCPFAKRLKQHQYLLCRARMNPLIDYTKIENACQAFCAYQHMCSITGRAENTDRARQCFKKHNQ